MQSSTMNAIDESEIPAPTPLKEDALSAGDCANSFQSSAKSDQAKRPIPEHKKQDAALTFPEKLMSMMQFADKQDSATFCVAWLPDGKSFVIRNPDEFTRKVVPKFFKATKFSSFTRKLYRWGFRQVNRGIGPDDPIIFGNEYFQRDNVEIMSKMRSITAASTRKHDESNMHFLAQKRALEMMENEQAQKRAFLMDQLMKQKSAAMNPAMFSNTGGMNLSQALRPGLHNGGFNMLQQFNSPSPMMSSFPQQAFGSFNGHQSNQNPTSTADIVNAAINALRYAP